jgi:hypothetical protein
VTLIALFYRFEAPLPDSIDHAREWKLAKRGKK